MKYDQFGQVHFDVNELCDLLYVNPDLDLSKFLVEDPSQFNQAVRHFYAPFPKLSQYWSADTSDDYIENFHKKKQSNWHMPDEYKNLDIADYILSLCKTEGELQRVGQELLLYQERNLFDLLRFMKYLIDTLRKNNIVWGVGRGSSVASYVLYLLGVHKINSMYYDLDIAEFLK